MENITGSITDDTITVTDTVGSEVSVTTDTVNYGFDEAEEATDDVSTVITTTVFVAPFLWRGNHPLWGEIIINIIVWFMFAATIVGNTLVIATFVQNKTVRNKISNLYILNLAISDFIIGWIPLGMNNVYRLSGIWPFGEKGCKLWLVTDFSACFVSVWAIALISYDRFVLVTKGLEYDKYQTRRKFFILSSMTWIGCFIRYGVGFIGYDFWNESNVDYSATCDSPILYILPLIITDWILSIILPVVLITFSNTVVYVSIFKRSRNLPRVNVVPEMSTVTMSMSVETAENTAAGEGTSAKAVQPRREGTTDIRKLRRSALTLALIVGVSVTCWGPYYAYIFATTLFNKQVHIIMIITTLLHLVGKFGTEPIPLCGYQPGNQAWCF